MTSDDIVERLRSQHHDLRQGAYYTATEDPTWDATNDAADEITQLRAEWDAARLHDNVAHACSHLHRMEFPDDH